jgi:hypothetical protein
MKRVLLSGLVFAAAISMKAQNCSDVFISEYVEGTQNDKAIELYNPTNQAIDLGAGQYKMGRARDGAPAPMLLNITGIIEPYGTRVFVLDKRNPDGTGNEVPISDALQALADTFVNPVYVQSDSPFYFNGDDAFALIKGTTVILDILGKIGEDPGGGWSQPGDPNTAWWTEDNTLIRKNTVLGGVTSNPLTFDPSLQWDSLPVNTFENLGSHTCNCFVSSIEESMERPSFDVFPNPISQGEFVLRSAKRMIAFNIVSSTGALVREKQFVNDYYQNITLPEVAPGVYMILVEFEDGSRNYQKLIFR